jgi:predicted enzyme related to lactoylglutathione lyase
MGRRPVGVVERSPASARNIGRMSIRIAGSTFDSDDAGRIARFWANILRRDIAARSEERALIAEVAPAEPWIGFARVPEAKQATNRMHIDLEAEDLDAEIARIEALGARTISEHREPFWDWNVMADPEGNEFCLGRILHR